MDDRNKHKFTARIADLEPFVFSVELSEEPVFRRAAYHVNELWKRMCSEQPGRSSHYILGKVALAFAELYYRKAEQLAAQGQLLDDFEKQLDSFLLQIDR